MPKPSPNAASAPTSAGPIPAACAPTFAEQRIKAAVFPRIEASYSATLRFGSPWRVTSRPCPAARSAIVRARLWATSAETDAA